MKKVYIAHPLRDDPAGNLAKATEICRQYAERGDVIPVSPLHAFAYLDPLTTDAYFAMQLCFGLLEKCDELWVHGQWWASEGCQVEICYAGCRGIPIRFPEMKKGLI